MSSSFNHNVITFAYPSPGDIVAAGAALPAVAILIVMLRFYIRKAYSVKLGLDDWLVLPALLMVIGMGATLIAGVEERAIGYPTPPPKTKEQSLTDIPRETIVTQKVEFIMTELVIVAYTFIKLSILSFYKRLFVSRARSVFNYVLWTQAAINILWCFAFFFAFLFGCGVPVSRQWRSNREDTIKYCKNSHARELSLYLSELVISVLLIITPLPAIWKLHMKIARKLAITGVMLLAFMALAASIARFVLVVQITTKRVDDVFDVDQTVSTLFYWGMIEGGLALIACCLPSLSALIKARAIQSAIRSARSAVSIPSNHPRHKGSIASTDLSREGGLFKPAFSHMTGATEYSDPSVDLALRPDTMISNECEVKAEKDPAKAVHVENGKILVQKDIHQADNMV